MIVKILQNSVMASKIKKQHDLVPAKCTAHNVCSCMIANDHGTDFYIMAIARIVNYVSKLHDCRQF